MSDRSRSAPLQERVYSAALEAEADARLELVEGLLDSTAGTLGPQRWTPTESVRALLEEVAIVCREKDVHVSDGFGESDPDARAWRRAAAKVEQLAARLK